MGQIYIRKCSTLPTYPTSEDCVRKRVKNIFSFFSAFLSLLPFLPFLSLLSFLSLLPLLPLLTLLPLFTPCQYIWSRRLYVRILPFNPFYRSRVFFLLFTPFTPFQLSPFYPVYPFLPVARFRYVENSQKLEIAVIEVF